eukprot:TRINITY_DN115970_c0_g1_i1.p1 TRINITY_DN115970_c0_g1~~TRINITY_DN115970_c0_g1_i1.p1  ORF type:complete len:233 (-),score=62.72 TRINITY_DN115970_c0_g1_i1:46-744(-)
MANKFSWRQYAETDPLYSLRGEVQEFKVFDPESKEVLTERLTGYCERIFVKGIVRRPKEWVDLWAAMLIPVDMQAQVLEVILSFAIEKKPDRLGDIVFELVRGMRVKLPAACTAFQGAFKDRATTHGCLSHLCYRIYPKSPHSAWGYSRVGWGWLNWWDFVRKAFAALDKTAAFDELSRLLERIEVGAQGVPLSKQELWSEDRCSKVRKFLCSVGSLDDEADLAMCLDATLS